MIFDVSGKNECCLCSFRSEQKIQNAKVRKKNNIENIIKEMIARWSLRIAYLNGLYENNFNTGPLNAKGKG